MCKNRSIAGQRVIVTVDTLLCRPECASAVVLRSSSALSWVDNVDAGRTV